MFLSISKFFIDFSDFLENFEKKFAPNKKTLTFAPAKKIKGSIAQLVQSICLTSRGPGVRIPLLPHTKNQSLA